jgi:hypothetical protein
MEAFFILLMTAAGTEPDAARDDQRGVEVDGHAYGGGRGADRGLDQRQPLSAVDHQGDPRELLLILRESGERGSVGGRVADHDVVVSLGQPQRLEQREGQDPLVSLAGEHPVDQRPAAYGLAGHSDRGAGGTAHEVVGVGVERLQVHGPDGTVETGGRPVEAFVLLGGEMVGSRDHDASVYAPRGARVNGR